MATPCVPTLGAVSFLTDVNQILVYVLRQYITMPKNRSNIYTDEIVSYMHDVSTISYDKTMMAATVEHSLSSVYDRIFSGSDVSVDVTCDVSSTEGSRYNLEISVTASDTNNTYLMTPSIIDDNGIVTIKNDTVYATPTNQ